MHLNIDALRRDARGEASSTPSGSVSSARGRISSSSAKPKDMRVETDAEEACMVEDKVLDEDFAEIESAFKEIDVLNEASVLQLSGAESLEVVESLSFCIDTTTEGLAHLGYLVPNLRELVLDGSHLVSFRDFGTSLKLLEVLHLRNSRVRDMDGIGALCALRELYLESNSIQDLTPLAMHDTLELLCLENNQVHELSEVDQLGTCRSLRFLTLANNPVAGVEHYRRIVYQAAPSLLSLDGLEIMPEDKRPVNDETLRQAVMALQQLWEATREETPSESSVQEEKSNREEEISSRAVQSGPGKGSLGRKEIPRLASMKNCTKSFNKASLSSSSNLTHGSDVVIAGNLAASMRRRRSGNGRNEGLFQQTGERLQIRESGEDGLTIMDSFHKALQDLSERSKILESDLRSLREEISFSPRPQRRRRYRKAADQGGHAVATTPRGKGPAVH